MGRAYRWLGRLGFWLLYLTGGVLLARFLFQVASGQAVEWEVVLVPTIASALSSRVRESASSTSGVTGYSAGVSGVVYSVLAIAWLATKLLTGADLGLGAILLFALCIDMFLAVVTVIRRLRVSEAVHP